MAEAKKLSWRMDPGNGSVPPWIADSELAPGLVYRARSEKERDECQANEDKLTAPDAAPPKKAKG
jgi:hypothetical protein